MAVNDADAQHQSDQKRSLHFLAAFGLEEQLVRKVRIFKVSL